MLRKSLIALWLLAGAAYADDPLDYPSIWVCDSHKPNWYCEKEEAKPAKPAPQPTRAAPVGKRREMKDIKTAEQWRTELKRREDLMVMNPSDPALVKDYIEFWQATQDKGAVLSDTWRRVVWQNPDLDYSLKRPANNVAVKTYDENRNKSEEEHLRALAKQHGLIFFFRSDCPYCHAMAPTLKMLSDRYGIEVLGVSIDGGGLPEFPNPRDGRAHAQAWGIERVPALFIGSKETADKAPVGFGMMSVSEIVNRIFVLTGTKPGQNF